MVSTITTSRRVIQLVLAGRNVLNIWQSFILTKDALPPDTLYAGWSGHGGMISSLWWIGIIGWKGDILRMNLLFLCMGALDPWNTTM